MCSAKLLKFTSLCGLLLLSSNTFAGSAGFGTLSYGPVRAIPFLNGGMLMVLAGILAIIAYRMLKQHKPQQRFLISLLALTGLITGMGGFQLINNANAVVVPLIELSNPGGGTVQIPNSLNEFQNTSGVNQTILSINLTQQCPGFPSGGPLIDGQECAVGLTLPDQATCVINCAPPID